MADRRIFEATLTRPHAIRTTVRLLDADERPAGVLTTSDTGLVDGSVMVDGLANVQRSMSITVVDQARKLVLDPNSPSDSVLWPTNFLAADYGVWVPDLDRWVEVPVFWGPMVHFRREGSEVQIDCLGKESLMRAPNLTWRPMTFRRRTRVTDAIRKIAQAFGETRFTIPEVSTRMRRFRSLARGDEAWLHIRKLARGIHRDVYYDGAGRLVVRAHPQDSTFLFLQGDDPLSSVLNVPTLDYNFDDLRNAVEVLGPDAEGDKRRVKAFAFPSRDHPLSPWSLARNGKARYVPERIENEHVHRKAAAQILANRSLSRLLTYQLDVEFKSLVIPHLEAWDIATLDAEIEGDRLHFDFPLRAFELPLTADGTMRIGHQIQPRASRRKKERSRGGMTT